MESAAGLTEIRQVVRQIVEGFHPRKVILFGSYAYGQPSADSDVDLLVVMDTALNPLRAAGLISGAVEHPLPLDIIVRRPADLDVYLAENSVFETEVTTKGVVLYEAKD